MRYYEVEQTRRIEVTASTPEDAMIIATREFAKSLNVQGIVPEEELQGRALTPVEITQVDIRKRI